MCIVYKTDIDWVIPQSIRQYHYSFLLTEKLFVAHSAALEDTCLIVFDTSLTFHIDFNNIMCDMSKKDKLIEFQAIWSKKALSSSQMMKMFLSQGMPYAFYYLFMSVVYWLWFSPIMTVLRRPLLKNRLLFPRKSKMLVVSWCLTKLYMFV